MTIAEAIRIAFADEFLALNFFQVILIFLVALVCSTVICIAYRVTYHGAVFSRSFCISLFAMPLITAVLIMAVRTNVYLSLGTLGALSIVRFRTSVKEPIDMAYLFLGVCAGIICGANLLGIALGGAVLVSLLLCLLYRLPRAGGNYILMITAAPDAEEELMPLLREANRVVRLKSKSKVGDSVELVFEVSPRRGNTAYVGVLSARTDVSDVSLVRSANDYV